MRGAENTTRQRGLCTGGLRAEFKQLTEARTSVVGRAQAASHCAGPGAPPALRFLPGTFAEAKARAHTLAVTAPGADFLPSNLPV